MAWLRWFVGFGALSLLAQGPSVAWRTFHTPHYRIHHPEGARFETFAREVAGRVEGIHAAVGQAVGHVASGPIDILVRDPVGEANGMAFPLLKAPYVEVWCTPPDEDSPLAHHRSWSELVLTHELVHLHHLTWPTERPTWVDRGLYGFTGPILRKAPRWVVEGYATLLEGRLTGRGRPHGAYRAAVIRTWALEGKLPDYEVLSGTKGFLGGSMAYGIGSAFLEWLEARHPEDPAILIQLWRRMADPRRRGFEACFEATFGLKPKDAYDRWRAEVTHDALAWERRMRPDLREGEGFARLRGLATDLAVSPDGTKLLARVLDPKRPGLWVWDLTAPPSAPPKVSPEGLPDRPPAFASASPRWIKQRRQGGLPRRAWWIGPGTILYELRRPDGRGMLQVHYRTWDVVTGQDRPGGVPPERPILAIQRWEVDGVWNLVRFEEDGTRTLLTRVRSAAWQPAPTPDGKRVYFLMLTAQGCEVRRLDVTEPALRPIPDPMLDLLVPGAVRRPEDGPSQLGDPVAVPPSKPYRARETHRVGVRQGWLSGPAVASYEIGLGGRDLLGRWN